MAKIGLPVCMVGKAYYNLNRAFLFIMATEQSQVKITITPKAAEKIKEFMKDEAEKPQYP